MDISILYDTFDLGEYYIIHNHLLIIVQETSYFIKSSDRKDKLEDDLQYYSTLPIILNNNNTKDIIYKYYNTSINSYQDMCDYIIKHCIYDCINCALYSGPNKEDCIVKVGSKKFTRTVYINLTGTSKIGEIYLSHIDRHLYVIYQGIHFII